MFHGIFGGAVLLALLLLPEVEPAMAGSVSSAGSGSPGGNLTVGGSGGSVSGSSPSSGEIGLTEPGRPGSSAKGVGTQPYTAKRCGAELKEGYSAFLSELRILNSNSRQDEAHAAKVTTLLTERDAAVRKHEAAHKQAAGKWGAQPVFTYYSHLGKKYAVAGCVELKPHTPLQTRIDTALAPNPPSRQDHALADEATRYLEIKQKRDECMKSARSTRTRCLKKYAEYSWLDRVKGW